MGGFLLLVAFAGCQQVETFKAARVYNARVVQIRQSQDALIAKGRELQKALETETWNRPKDYQLQKDGNKVKLWRWSGGPPDKDGNRQGRICVLNPEPQESYSCNGEQRKIGLILLDIEETDRLFVEGIKEREELFHAATKSPTPDSP
jgi:hypothetical protein